MKVLDPAGLSKETNTKTLHIHTEREMAVTQQAWRTMTHTYRRRIVCCFFVCHLAWRKNIFLPTFCLRVLCFCEETELLIVN